MESYINRLSDWIRALSSGQQIGIALATLVIIITVVLLATKRKSKPVATGNLRDGLASSRGQFWGKITAIISGGNLSTSQLEEVEELLYGADMGPTATAELIEQLRKNKTDDFKTFFYKLLESKMSDSQKKIDQSVYRPTSNKLVTIMVVGINGAGKTTTIGKLATKLKLQGADVVVGACDTFRAAAVDQLQVWCDRSGAHMVRAKEGANPSGVAYEALQYAQSVKAQYCILDTAGRLHTKTNLMKELSKTQQVLKKLDASAPTHSLLVLDAITGQNALRQAEEFNQELGLTGLVFTKCDGSSKAGSAIPIVDRLQLPIYYIGVGESVDDLREFDLDEYLIALLDVD